MAVRAHEVDWRDIYIGRIRAIESLYGETHKALLEWGRYGADLFPGRPQMMLSGIWVLVGDPDPNRDPDAVPEGPKDTIDERMVIALDVRITRPNFPTIWRAVLKANYLPPKGCLHILPEYQRPSAAAATLRKRAPEAQMGHETYIEQLSNALDFLREGAA